MYYMDFSRLRVGSFVSDGDRVVSLTSLQLVSILTGRDGGVYGLIPITVERLKVLGFKKLDNGGYWKAFGGSSSGIEIIIGKDGYYPHLYDYCPISGEQVVSLGRIEYLHELQDIYFMGCGVEMVID